MCIFGFDADTSLLLVIEMKWFGKRMSLNPNKTIEEFLFLIIEEPMEAYYVQPKMKMCVSH